jgi:hypothetical protein
MVPKIPRTESSLGVRLPLCDHEIVSGANRLSDLVRGITELAERPRRVVMAEQNSASAAATSSCLMVPLHGLHQRDVLQVPSIELSHDPRTNSSGLRGITQSTIEPGRFACISPRRWTCFERRRPLQTPDKSVSFPRSLTDNSHHNMEN